MDCVRNLAIVQGTLAVCKASHRPYVASILATYGRIHVDRDRSHPPCGRVPQNGVGRSLSSVGP